MKIKIVGKKFEKFFYMICTFYLAFIVILKNNGNNVFE